MWRWGVICGVTIHLNLNPNRAKKKKIAHSKGVSMRAVQKILASVSFIRFWNWPWKGPNVDSVNTVKSQTKSCETTKLNLSRFKDPVRLAVVVHVIPPSQTDHQPSRYVFNRPEIHRQQQNDRHETRDKTVTEPATQHVHHHGRASEGQVEECNVRVSETDSYNRGLLGGGMLTWGNPCRRLRPAPRRRTPQCRPRGEASESDPVH